MQTLGLSDSGPRGESRLKSLFWPAIRTGSDVDYLGAQGYWVCAVVAVVSLVLLSFSGHPLLGLLVLIFYFLGGVGVRERSRYAATLVLVSYVLEGLALVGYTYLWANPGIVLRFVLTVLLLSNFRATWMAARWQPDSDEAARPPRMGESWSDRFVDRLPIWLWPKLRGAYYVFGTGYLLLTLIGILTMMLAAARRGR